MKKGTRISLENLRIDFSTRKKILERFARIASAFETVWRPATRGEQQARERRRFRYFASRLLGGGKAGCVDGFEHSANKRNGVVQIDGRARLGILAARLGVDVK